MCLWLYYFTADITVPSSPPISSPVAVAMGISVAILVVLLVVLLTASLGIHLWLRYHRKKSDVEPSAANPPTQVALNLTFSLLVSEYIYAINPVLENEQL